MTHEPIHYVPVVEQRYAEIIENLKGHPYRNQWSRVDRVRLSANLRVLAVRGLQPPVPGDRMIPMAVDLLQDLANWLPDAAGFSPAILIELLESYVQPKSER